MGRWTPASWTRWKSRTRTVKDRLAALLAGLCGQEPEQVTRDMKRDHFLTAWEAVDYGLADRVLEAR